MLRALHAVFPIFLVFASGLAIAQGQNGPGADGFFVVPPEPVRVEKDISYAETKNPRQTLDLYLPKQPKVASPLPVIVNIHGGAFRDGDKTMGVTEVLGLVSSGDYALVSIEYRLTGEAIWPAQIYDCKAAIRWVRANAKKHNLDPEKIGVIGESAGGYLSAMLGMTGADDGLEGDVGPYKGTSTKVRCVVDEFGPSDLLTMGGNHDAPGSPESILVGGPLQKNKDQARAASPITYISKNDPPFLILHGTADPKIPFSQSERFTKSLKKAGVECYFVPIKGAGHGGFRSPEVPKLVRQFFDTHLRGQDVGKISEQPVTNDKPSRKR
jgi:acetyl esterase/lipase